MTLSMEAVALPFPKGENSARQRVAALLAPAGLVILALLLCSVAVLRLSFGEKGAEWDAWALTNYALLLEPVYVRAFVRTVLLSAASAAIAVILGFPVALYLARASSTAVRRLLLISVMLPMLVSLLVQSYGWIALLGPHGLINRMAALVVDTDRPIALLFNQAGVLLGLVQTSLPLAVLPMASALGAIPRPLEEAAGVLGASRSRVYREIIFPLAMPGIVSGAVLVFAFNTGAFAVPLLLGGARVTTVALLIRDQMGALLDWPLGAAFSVVLVLIVMGVLLLRRLAPQP